MPPISEDADGDRPLLPAEITTGYTYTVVPPSHSNDDYKNLEPSSCREAGLVHSYGYLPDESYLLKVRHIIQICISDVPTGRTQYIEYRAFW